jgi:hypothetical protein
LTQNPGSGVIIARQGQTYYVLTAEHVVATEDEYEIITSDGKKYRLDYKNVKKLPDPTRDRVTYRVIMWKTGDNADD